MSSRITSLLLKHQIGWCFVFFLAFAVTLRRDHVKSLDLNTRKVNKSAMSKQTREAKQQRTKATLSLKFFVA